MDVSATTSTSPYAQSQGMNSSKTENSSAKSFLEYMEKTPEEWMFESFLKKHDMTPEEFEKLSPEKKQALLKEFEDEMKMKARL